MEKIKKIFENSSIINPFIIVLVMLVCVVFFGNLHCSILSDRGREFIIPQEILHGQIPYKDITLIYFPFAYYINAFLYKLFGISTYTFLITQTFLCIVYMLFFYFLSKEFINKTTSLLLTLLITVSCVFARNDLFSLIFPYSFARAYGVIASFFSIFCFVKLFKTDNIKFLYLSAFLTGFAFCCKFEFIVTVVLFLIGLLLYKKLTITQYFKILLTGLITPLFTCFLLCYQGISISDIIGAIKFGIRFSATPVMAEFLSIAGVYPFNFVSKLKIIMKYIPALLTILFFSYIALKLEYKYAKKYFLPCFAIIIFYFYFNTYTICLYWTFLPYLVAILFLITFKDNLTNDKTVFFIILASILAGHREFFRLTLDHYGTYSFPMYFLSLLIIIKKYIPPQILDVNVNRFINFFLIILISMHFYNLCLLKEDAVYPLKSNKGTLYTKYTYGILLNDTISYINEHVDKDDTILTLPEGTLINFLTDRKVDMNCFMMDRLYHDAYGEAKAKDVIEKTNSDYIILFKGFDLNNFHLPYIYDVETSLSGLYIAEHYDIVEKFRMDNSSVTILKRSSIIKHIDINKMIKDNQDKDELYYYNKLKFDNVDNIQLETLWQDQN